MSGNSAPAENRLDWITIKAAAKKLGKSIAAVRLLCNDYDPLAKPMRPYLRSWQPTSRKLLIDAGSVDELIRSEKADPQFWDKRRAVPIRRLATCGHGEGDAFDP